MLRLLHGGTMLVLGLLIAGCGRAEAPVPSMTFDLALDETRTSGPVKLIFRRLAMIERIEAKLAKEVILEGLNPR